MNDRPRGQSAAVARCAVCAAYEADDVRAAEPHRGDVLALDLRDASRRCSPHSDPRRLPAELAPAIGPGGLLHLTVRTDDLTPELWEDLLVEAGFTVDDMTTADTANAADTDTDNADAVVGMGTAGRPGGHRLIRARRRDRTPYPRVASSARVGARPPTAHAMIGVGVIVRDGAGRVLLGLHRGGTWELPGGALEPGESVAAAAVRELREETGLRAHEHDVTVFAMLLDTAAGARRADRPDTGDDADGADGTNGTGAGLTRVTMAAVVTVYDGAVLAAEPELIRHWRWTRADELPSPLFTPSAQVLAAWRPELDIEHGPVHRLDVMDRTAPGTGPGSGPGSGSGSGSGSGTDSGPASGPPVQRDPARKPGGSRPGGSAS